MGIAIVRRAAARGLAAGRLPPFAWLVAGCIGASTAAGADLYFDMNGTTPFGDGSRVWQQSSTTTNNPYWTTTPTGQHPRWATSPRQTTSRQTAASRFGLDSGRPPKTPMAAATSTSATVAIRAAITHLSDQSSSMPRAARRTRCRTTRTMPARRSRSTPAAPTFRPASASCSMTASSAQPCFASIQPRPKATTSGSFSGPTRPGEMKARPTRWR